MKRFLKKSLICILIVAILVGSPNFAFAGGGLLADIGSGLLGLFTWIIRAPLMALMMGIHGIVTALVKIGAGDIASYGGAAGLDDFFLTPFHIFFNKVTILDVNFLNLDVTGTVLIFRQAVAGWYYTMRLIACMVLAVILIYIGIRMAISTVATEKAMYKKMLVDWATSLALLFLLHYIMIFTFACNDALVGALENVAESGTGGNAGSTMSTFMSNLSLKALDFVPDNIVNSFAAIGVYGIVVIQTLGFVLAYIKRMLTVGFLIIIAPLITITYSIDRIGDGKAQALNTWLKEFVYNILIQPFHCILFLSFAGVAMDLLALDKTAGDGSIATAVLAVLCIQYVKTGEELVKKIFGFGQASSVASMAAGTAMAMTAMAKGKEAGKAVGSVAAKGKNAIANTKQFKSLKASMSKNASNIKSAIKSKHNERSAKKSDKKLDKKAMAEFAKQHGKEADKNNSADKKELDAIKKSLIANNVAKRERKVAPFISGVKKNASDKMQRFADKHKHIAGIAGLAKNVVTLPAGLARDAGQYMVKNNSKIIAGTVGMAMGVAGLANGGTGFITGYKSGSGMVEGFMSNSNKTIKENLSGAAQAKANLTGNYDTASNIYSSKVNGENEAFKDMKKEIQNLLAALQKAGQTDQTANQVTLGNLQKMLYTNPASLTKDSVKETIRSTMGDEAADNSAIVDMFSSHMAFEADALLYKEIKNTESTGRTTDDIVDIVGDLSPQQPVDVDDIEIETKAEIDYNALARDIAGYVHTTSNEDMQNAGSRELESQITELNTAINGLNSKDEVHKTEILQALQRNNQSFANKSTEEIKVDLTNAVEARKQILEANP